MKRLLLIALAVLPGIAFSQSITWTPLVDEYYSFTLTAPGTVRFGVDTFWVQKDFQPGYYNCGAFNFGLDPAINKPKKCELGKAAPVVVPAVPLVDAPACYYEEATTKGRFYTDIAGNEITEVAFALKMYAGAVQKSIFATAYWICGAETHSVTGRGDEVAYFLGTTMLTWANPLTTKAQKDAIYIAAFNACVPDKECITYDKQIAIARTKLAALVPVVTAPQYVVQPASATLVGDRPVYRLKADGTRNTTAVAGKRAVGNTPCGVKRIGTTSYYDIPSLKDATGDVYAVCVLK